MREPEAQPHKLLPSSLDAEMGVIGSILQNKQVMITCELVLNESLFHHGHTRIIYQTIKQLWNNKIPFDLITVTQKIKDLDLLDEIGGGAFITECFTYIPGSDNVMYYIEILREKKALRVAIVDAEKLIKICYHEQDRANELPALLKKSLSHVIQAGETQINESLTEWALTKLQTKITDRLTGDMPNISTGISAWDESLKGIFPGRFYAIGARPKVGKSAMIEQMMQHQIELDNAVLIFQRDMAVTDMIDRMACRKAGVIYEDFIHGNILADDLMNIRLAAEELDPNLLRSYSPGNMTAEEMISIIEREIKDHDIKVFYLDLFQRLKTKDGDKVEGLTNAANSIRDVIQSTGISGVVIAEISKIADTTGRPHAGQFKYCDGLFSCCDTAIMLWTTDDPKKLVEEGTGNYRRQKINFTIDANRGSVSDNPIYFDRPHMTFYASP